MREVVKVVSTNINTITYTSETNTLEILFNSGYAYQYFDVPKNIFNLFTQASSKGKFFSKYIRNKYEYKKIQYEN